MRIIEYKKKGNSQFEKYVDIGSIERNIDILPLFDETKHTYQEWYKEIINEPLGVIITIINYYKLELDNEFFSKVTDKIKSNIKIYTEFNNKWFEEDTSLFKGLDLNFENIEEEIELYKEDNSGNKTEIYFKDRSVIKFLDNDDRIQSFYIAESEYKNFVYQVNNIINLLK
jgi:hypothetical protein